MGRVKLEIKKIVDPSRRDVTYSKRSIGLMKKAFELSVLCDIDIAVIMFSPSGKLTVFNDRVEEVIARFANTPVHMRTKGTFENVEYPNKVVEQLRDERGLEAPRIGYADLQLENEKLKATFLKLGLEKTLCEQKATFLKLGLEKTLCEQKARIMGGFNNVNSMEDLANLKLELEGAVERVQAQMTQLQEPKPVIACRQNAFEQNSSYIRLRRQ